jgi:NtrC-family two-component system response regulator AlgB
VRDQVGRVAAAEGGTLFLDEVGELPGPLQAKLLRLLQEKCYERVGDIQTRTANVRFLAATNRDLERDATTGKFREDLLYRLNVLEVTLPPLRQRPRDILPLAEHFLRFFARQANKHALGFTAAAEAALRRHHWPGNIRELRNAVERGVILASAAQVSLSDLPVAVSAPAPPSRRDGYRMTLEEMEAKHIRHVLASTSSLEEAATALGIDPSTLYRKRKRYGL